MISCPKCTAPMGPVTFADVTVQRCTVCEGIWFDGVTYRSLKKEAGAEELDTGLASTGRKNDAMTGVLCPVCRTVLEVTPDLYQRHIHYDVCPNGDGVYFDAGEFRDFVIEDFADFFKDLFSGKRKPS